MSALHLCSQGRSLKELITMVWVFHPINNGSNKPIEPKKDVINSVFVGYVGFHIFSVDLVLLPFSIPWWLVKIIEIKYKAFSW